ncbi:Nucleolar protein 12 [Parahypoxylon ruwenzoriense]
MAKSKSSTLAASTKAIDPTLDALFASSAGPVQAPSKSRYSGLLPLKERKLLSEARDAAPNPEEESADEDDVEDDESLSEIDGDIEEEDIASEVDGDASKSSGPSGELQATEKKARKRKRRDEHDDLEDKYMRKLTEDTEKEERLDKRRKGEAGQAINGTASEKEDLEEDEEAPPVHESLLQKTEDHADIEIDKANRTLFLGNVSTEVITSSQAKKLLMSHLSSPLSTLESAGGPHKVESIRFRSTAYSTGAMPKRAAFITKSVMSATTKSTNAYVVYSTPLAARTALKALNGTVILERHMRVDSVAHPTAVDHRRCVFVGNLGFVDDETVINTNAGGETTTKKRTKVPADVEEGLWQTFGEHAGKIESVRVPRDSKTRVGKGFAYVQFYDANDVESALLLDGKKFPPLLPRVLRVSRAKDPRKTALAMERTVKAKLEGINGRDSKTKSTTHRPKVTPEQQSQAGRAGKLLGRAAAARQRHGLRGESGQLRDSKVTAPNGVLKTPEQIVFEGRRASAKDGKPRDMKFGKVKGKKGMSKTKTKSRGARRAAEWRKKAAK